MKAIAIHLTKSLFNMEITSETLAPFILRIPISFVRCFARNIEVATNPRDVIATDMIENNIMMRDADKTD